MTALVAVEGFDWDYPDLVLTGDGAQNGAALASVFSVILAV